jgi:hypothetical protein
MAASFTQLTAEVAAIVDPLSKEKATNLLEIYVAAWPAMANSAPNAVISYSIAGRSVTRKNDSDFGSYVRSVETQIMQLIYGSTSYVDDSGTPLR